MFVVIQFNYPEKENVLRRYPIYHLSFTTQYLLTSTFLRFQEFYESPRFAGKVFTLEEFMDWYAREQGNFTYFSDWAGFNVPSRVLEAFYRGRFNPLSVKETLLLKMFRRTRPPFYVIATYGKSPLILHEVVHGLYFIDKEYREKVKETLKKLNLKRLRRILLGMGGYGREVIDDEMNAYLLTGLTAAMRRLGLKRAAKTMKVLFKEHFRLDIDSKRDQKLLLGRIWKQKFRV